MSKKRLSRHTKCTPRKSVAEKEGFEPSGPVKGLLDFEEGERRKSQAYRGVLAYCAE